MDRAKKPVKTALLGVGRMGANHLRVLSMMRSCDLRWIYDRDAARLQDLGSRFDVRGTTVLEEALDGVEAVVIATPTTTHAELFHQVAPRVRNIFVEKPLAAGVVEAQRCKLLAEQHGNHIQVGYIERFNPAVVELARVMSADEPFHIEFTRTDRVSSRVTDVDVVTDLMIHDIDLALYLNGPVVATRAYGRLDGQLVGFASADFTHESGVHSHVLASRMTERKLRRIEATCAGAFVECDLLRKEVLVHRQTRISEETSRTPYIVSSQREQVSVQLQEALLTELAVFIDGCRGTHDGRAAGVDVGVETMALCQQIKDAILGQGGQGLARPRPPTGGAEQRSTARSEQV
jgi:predicted dehydrogenase